VAAGVHAFLSVADKFLAAGETDKALKKMSSALKMCEKKLGLDHSLTVKVRKKRSAIAGKDDGSNPAETCAERETHEREEAELNAEGGWRKKHLVMAAREKEAKNGCAAAAWDMVSLYIGGCGEEVRADTKQAMAWLRKAAQLGHRSAQNNLGQYLLNGQYQCHLPSDRREAAVWLQKAAEQNHPSAMYMLAEMYYSGDPMPVDKPRALGLFQRSAALGDLDACCRLGHMTMEGEIAHTIYETSDSTEQVGPQSDQRAAMHWFYQAARMGHQEGIDMLHLFCVHCATVDNTPGAIKRCLRCKVVGYCSRDCQRKHWKHHKKECPKLLAVNLEPCSD
jgi:hypothetical protein